MEIKRLKEYLSLRIRLLELKTEYKLIRLLGIFFWLLAFLFATFFLVIAFSILLGYLLYSTTQNLFFAFFIPFLFHMGIGVALLLTKRYWIQLFAETVYRLWHVTKQPSYEEQETHIGSS